MKYSGMAYAAIVAAMLFGLAAIATGVEFAQAYQIKWACETQE